MTRAARGVNPGRAAQPRRAEAAKTATPIRTITLMTSQPFIGIRRARRSAAASSGSSPIT